LYSTVKEWAKQFLLGRESIEDELREGQPVVVVTEENVRCIEEELLSDRQLMLKEISDWKFLKPLSFGSSMNIFT